mmetsp:Transcript_59832/g.69273  ORF Transcript_59832/g.69273 Transcript_59832/m.69273 type:complete len:295 (+) Transcript_59832:3-887(+)
MMKNNKKNAQNVQQSQTPGQQTWVPMQPMNQQGANPQQYQNYAPQKPQYYISEQSNYHNTPQQQSQGIPFAPKANQLNQSYNGNTQGALLNAQQYGTPNQGDYGSPGLQSGQYQPNYVSAGYQSPGAPINPRLSQLEIAYQSFKHYPVANLIFIGIAIIQLFYDVISTVALESHVFLCDYVNFSAQSRQGCRMGDVKYALSKALQTILIAVYILIIVGQKLVACGIFFMGKKSYDEKNAKWFRLLMIICGMLSVAHILKLALYEIAIFGYLAFCAWRLRGLSEEYNAVKASLLA